MDFHHVNSSRHHALHAGLETTKNHLELLVCHFVGEIKHVVMEFFAAFLHLASREKLRKSIRVVFRMEDLKADFGPVGVERIREGFESRDLGVHEEFRSWGEGWDGDDVA